jgi:hypothetical protein
MKKTAAPLDYTARKSAPSMRRRRFLRGIGGVALGLPFLEALAPRRVQAQAALSVKRCAVFFACNGVNMDRWFPNGDFGALSADMLAGTANEVLGPYVDKLLFPRGVHMSPRGFDRDGGGGDDHGKGMAHKLTAQFADEQDWLALGPSLDYLLAQEINPGNEGARRPALNLMAGRAGHYHGLDYISYSGPTQAILAVNNPYNAYADFINLDQGDASVEANARLLARRESVLDLVSAQFDDLKAGPLSSADKQKLDAHFTAIREIEQTMTSGALSCLDDTLLAATEPYDGIRAMDLEANDQYPTVAALLVDIMALALACDSTRVATLQFDHGAGGPIFKWDGMNHEYNHHKLSHGKVRDDCFGDSTDNGCADVAGYEDMLFDIDVWHQKRFAQLLERLESYTEEDGKSVLDNSVILYSNELSDGKGHSFMDLPYILAGSAGGYFKQGQYVLLGEGTAYDDSVAPHNRLLNTIQNAMGVASDWFGAPEGSGGETMQGGVYEQLLA